MDSCCLFLKICNMFHRQKYAIQTWNTNNIWEIHRIFADYSTIKDDRIKDSSFWLSNTLKSNFEVTSVLDPPNLMV